VLRVLNRSGDRTFFQAVSILDRFFSEKQKLGFSLNKSDLHLYGLVSCFIASKIEDKRPIKMNEVIKEAGHGKFSLEKILEAERDIYLVLHFKLVSPLLLDAVIATLR